MSADHADPVQLLAVAALHVRNQLHRVPERLRAVRAALWSSCKQMVARHPLEVLSFLSPIL